MVRFDIADFRARAGAFAVDTVYPKRCAGCGIRGSWVCQQCLDMLPLFESPICPRCGIPVTERCRCAFVPAAIDVLRSAGPYDGWLRDSVHMVKYQGESSRAEHLASLLSAAAAEFSGIEALVAVPLHRNRLRERGFNQAELIARELSRSVEIPVWNALSRTRDTLHQVGLPIDQRAINVAGAFSYRDDLSMRASSVILVDDVFTTGATLGECAAVLKSAGVPRVVALTVC